MKTEFLRADHPVALQHAVDVLEHGGLVAFPTDTVYGLAAPPFTVESVERLFVVKGRNSDKAIAILLADLQDLDHVASTVPAIFLQLARRFWPGPLTLVAPRHASLPEVLVPQGTVGVRMPDHPIALALLRQTGPLAVTSANLSGGESAKDAQEVMRQLGGRIHLILDGGPTPGGIPSTVVDCTGPEVVLLRSGPIPLQKLKSALE